MEVTKEIEPDEEMVKKLEEYKGIRILIDISRVQGPRTEILTNENQKHLTEFLLPNL